MYVSHIYFSDETALNVEEPVSVCDPREAATVITPFFSPSLFFFIHTRVSLSALCTSRGFLYFEEVTDLIGLAGKQSGWIRDSCRPEWERICRWNLLCVKKSWGWQGNTFFASTFLSCGSALNNLDRCLFSMNTHSSIYRVYNGHRIEDGNLSHVHINVSINLNMEELDMLVSHLIIQAHFK